MIARFATVGVANSVLDFVLFLVLVHVFRVPPVAANVASYGAGVLNSFALNRSWTFATTSGRSGVAVQMAAFLCVNLGGLIFSTMLVWAAGTDLPPAAAKALATAATFGMNYCGSRFVVFR
jgi:putative flippase GtrA